MMVVRLSDSFWTTLEERCFAYTDKSCHTAHRAGMFVDLLKRCVVYSEWTDERVRKQLPVLIPEPVSVKRDLRDVAVEQNEDNRLLIEYIVDSLAKGWDVQLRPNQNSTTTIDHADILSDLSDAELRKLVTRQYEALQSKELYNKTWTREGTIDRAVATFLAYESNVYICDKYIYAHVINSPRDPAAKRCIETVQRIYDWWLINCKTESRLHNSSGLISASSGESGSVPTVLDGVLHKVPEKQSFTIVSQGIIPEPRTHTSEEAMPVLMQQGHNLATALFGQERRISANNRVRVILCDNRDEDYEAEFHDRIMFGDNGGFAFSSGIDLMQKYKCVRYCIASPINNEFILPYRQRRQIEESPMYQCWEGGE